MKPILLGLGIVMLVVGPIVCVLFLVSDSGPDPGQVKVAIGSFTAVIIGVLRVLQVKKFFKGKE